MFGAILLAYRYLMFERVKTALLLSALILVSTVIPAVQWTIRGFEQETRKRSETTPLVVGAPGSRFSLVLQTLYFQGETLPRIRADQTEQIREWQRGTAIPLYVRFKAQGYPIIGTTGDYFELRGFSLSVGNPLERIGDCLIGSEVAKSLGLKAGDRLLSDPENAFDLAGPSALNLRVQGILNTTHSPDDHAVFCTLDTTWIIEGLGHGHEPAAADDSSHAANDNKSAGDASVATYRHAGGRENPQRFAEVTDDNVSSFHFHGSKDSFPITSIIVTPESEKSAVILMGKFLEPDAKCQIVRTRDTVDEMMQLIGRARRAVDIGGAVLMSISLLLVGLVISLSLRLRRGEMQTLKRLGAGRFDIVRLLAVEYIILGTISLTIGFVSASLVSGWTLWWLRSLL